jgi:alanyl-tRNA synthetase
MTSAEIRKQFLEFFQSKGHAIVPSSPVVPHEDPTLLFTNAGMNQFKDVFLGFDKRPYTRATTAQKCIRAGGKHNDLENVGYTARHHTFFEMLGNFSFGDYFKRDALLYAWELLTQVFRLPADRLWVTVYAEDDEAYGIWAKEVGVPAERILRIGDNKGARYASDNFWMMGDTGPCGPCSEIFYDHGPGIPGGPPGSPDEDGDRYIEIWNNVFMQFNRDEQGVMHPLPKPSVDTGMGLERIAAVLQHVHSNYEIDLFRDLIGAAAAAVAAAGGRPPADSPSLRVIADHIRACAFIVADGVIPGNEGRGYVLRRIARRAIRHGYKLGARSAFFHRLVEPLAKVMGDAYPELRRNGERITEVLRAEEERFFETIAHGMSLLEEALAAVGPDKVLDGETAFRLHDTFGFPLDLTADVCRERGVTVDEAGFDKAMDRQREQARAAGKFRQSAALEYSGMPTRFHGYEVMTRDAEVVALYRDGTAVERLEAGDRGVVVLDHTPFYAEAGGQVGDKGTIERRAKSADRAAPGGTGEGTTARFEVDDTLRIQADVSGHHGVLRSGTLSVGDHVGAAVDVASRQRIMRNHSVTHLMHKALREVLGSHVQQKGSLVDADRTRFDFSHNTPVTAAQMREVEIRVNAEIMANTATEARVLPYDEAVKGGAMALFGEKYGDTVRVLDIGTSRELCGGTHVARTGDIGAFKIASESGVAAGIRRIEAVTGDNAVAYVQQLTDTLERAAGQLRAGVHELPDRIAQLQEQARSLEREVSQLKSRLASTRGNDLAAGAVAVKGAKLVTARLDGVDPRSLRTTVDQLKGKLGSGVVVLAAVDGDKVQLAAGVTPDLTAHVKAGELVAYVAGQVGGKGGGKPDFAMAGGHQPAAVAGALESVRTWVEGRLP